MSIRAMALMLGRSPSTVSRELTRNSSPAGYASVPAQALLDSRVNGFMRYVLGGVGRRHPPKCVRYLLR
uniref:helix-turn-helix domain-containing protein n=1 Tax=Caballeronia arvi TaxID=1777135 RepID=UPI0038991306